MPKPGACVPLGVPRRPFHSTLEMPMCALQENVPQVRSFKPGSISAAELRALADSLRRQSPGAAYRHSALLQLAEVAAAALEGPHAGELCMHAWKGLCGRRWLPLQCSCAGPRNPSPPCASLCQRLAVPGPTTVSTPALHLPQPLLQHAWRCLLSIPPSDDLNCSPTAPSCPQPLQNAGRRSSGSSASCCLPAPSQRMRQPCTCLTCVPWWHVAAAAAAALQQAVLGHS